MLGREFRRREYRPCICCVLQAPDALNGDVEATGEHRVTVRIATRGVDPAEEAPEYLPAYGFTVRRKWNAGFDATKDSFRRVTKEVFQNPCTSPK